MEKSRRKSPLQPPHVLLLRPFTLVPKPAGVSKKLPGIVETRGQRKLRRTPPLFCVRAGFVQEHAALVDVGHRQGSQKQPFHRLRIDRAGCGLGQLDFGL